jgi:2-C-methyl-D-erythritol 4-phosphate cytidylyltransferase
MPRVAVILPAAGRSTRFGGARKKPYLELDGKPVWLRTAELFLSRADVVGVWLVVGADDRADFVAKHGPTLMFRSIRVVAGGAERFDSVANALAEVPAEVDLVAVHDAVRPLTAPALIDAVFAAAAAVGAALPAVAVADTLKRATADRRVTATVPRADLWQAQTPQVVRRDWLCAGYAQRHTLGTAITDDVQLVEALGHPVQIVPGEVTNFKLTTPADLQLAQALLAARDAAAPAPARHPFADDDW